MGRGLGEILMRARVPGPRLPDWAERLAEYLAHPHVFSWTGTNCGQFAAGAVEAITGHDVGAVFRGAKTRRQQLAILKRVAGGDIEAAALMIGGEPLANPTLAQRGDVVSVPTPQGPALGICTGRDVAVLTPDNGVDYVPLRVARMAWRAG